jgi:hypothetical protein
VAARLERDISGGAAGSSPSDSQGFDFGMVAAEALMPSFANHAAVGPDQQTADHRIRFDKTFAARRQFQRPTHVPQIEFVLRH